MQFVFVVAAACLGLGACPESCSGQPHPAKCIAEAANVSYATSHPGRGGGAVRTSRIERDRPGPSYSQDAEISTQVVDVCRASVEEVAPLEAVDVDAVATGSIVLGPDGVLRAPLEIQIVYSDGEDFEVRRSLVECHVDRDGRVVALEGMDETPDDETTSQSPHRSGDTVEATGSLSSPGSDGGDVVAAFYRALAAGDGGAAAQYVVPEKQREGPLSAREISRYFGGLARPLQTHRIVQTEAERYEVRYSYGIGGRDCAGSARVTLTSRDGVTYIESISAAEDCS